MECASTERRQQQQQSFITRDTTPKNIVQFWINEQQYREYVVHTKKATALIVVIIFESFFNARFDSWCDDICIFFLLVFFLRSWTTFRILLHKIFCIFSAVQDCVAWNMCRMSIEWVVKPMNTNNNKKISWWERMEQMLLNVFDIDAVGRVHTHKGCRLMVTRLC